MIDGEVYTMTVRAGKYVSLIGYDMGGDGDVVARNANTIAVKWPRGTHWTGNYMPRAYHPASTQVFHISEKTEHGLIERLRVTKLIELGEHPKETQQIRVLTHTSH